MSIDVAFRLLLPTSMPGDEDTSERLVVLTNVGSDSRFPVPQMTAGSVTLSAETTIPACPP